MDIQTEKYRLIQQIVELQDSAIVKKIQDLLVTEQQQKELSIMEKKLIEKGRKDFNNNSFHKNEEVKERVKNRFNFS